MARKKTPAPPSRFPIGNCEVIIEGAAKSFTCDSKPNCLEIRASRNTRVEISVKEFAEAKLSDDSGNREQNTSTIDCQFVLVNPKDADSSNKTLVQEVLSLYTEELPDMRYAANTGKKSTFLQRCVSNGKYCTLLLKSNNMHCLGQIIAAVSYQIVPTDTRYAEIPLAAVSSIYQQKGIGQILYMELRQRLQAVGVGTVLCWGDMKTEGFWHKQGFVSIAEVDSKGKPRKLHLKADIRRALSFPGGSVLMMSQLNMNDDLPANSIKLNVQLNSHGKSAPAAYMDQNPVGRDDDGKAVIYMNKIPNAASHLQPGEVCPQSDSAEKGQFCFGNSQNVAMDLDSATETAQEVPSTSERKGKRTVWEASISSLKSKRVKASIESETRENSYSDGCHLGSSAKARSISEVELSCPLMDSYLPKNYREVLPVDLRLEASLGTESQTKEKPAIMLMDIADGAKKIHLTKVIEHLGGNVTPDGRSSSHLLTAKVRKTLNFCTALCSGAWILSPNWLKTSYREGRFVDVMPFILEDEDYRTKFKINLKEAVLRARTSPGGLLKGYQIHLTTHVQPPIETLSAIIRSAGGIVVYDLDDVIDKSRAVCVASEEDMEEALLAVRKGLRTFSSDWFMSCIMKQELDLDASQFAESL